MPEKALGNGIRPSYQWNPPRPVAPTPEVRKRPPLIDLRRKPALKS